MLEVGTVVKINMDKVQLGHAGGDYQVVFFVEEGPLWFSREELIDTGKRGPGAIGDMSR